MRRQVRCPKCGKTFSTIRPRVTCYRCGTSWNTTGCYVVTATYGLDSPEAVHVKRKCRQRFSRNPLLVIGWCLYQFYGPFFARWSQPSTVGYKLCKTLLANPIINATSDNWLLSVVYMLYLAAISILGLLLFVPSYAASLILGLFTSGSNQSPSATDGEVEES